MAINRFALMMRTVFIFISLLLIIFSAAAAGQGEDRLKVAKNLMEQKDYDAAIKILSLIIEQEPNKEEKANAMIFKIMQKDKEYFAKVEELIEVLYEEGNFEKGLTIADELEAIRPNPNEENKEMVALAREAASLVANSNYFNELMDEARKFLDEYRYYDAVTKYLSGFNTAGSIDFFKGKYEKAKLGNISRSTLDEALATLMKYGEAFQETSRDVRRNIEQLEAKLPDPGDTELDLLIDTLITDFLEAFDIARNIESTIYILDRENKQIKELGDELSGAVFHLTFISQLTKGRVAEEKPEGILETIDLMNEHYSRVLAEKIKKEADVYFEQGLENYRAKDYDQSLVSMEKAFNLYSLNVPLAYFRDKEETLPVDYILQEKGNWRIEDELKNFMLAQEEAKSASSYIKLIGVLEELDYFAEIRGVPENEERVKNEVTRIMNEIKEVVDDWKTYIRLGKTIIDTGFNAARANTIVNLSGYISSVFINEYLRILKITYEEIITGIEGEIALFEEGVKEVATDTEGNELTQTFYYPDSRLIFFTKTKKLAAAFHEKVTGILDLWQEDGDTTEKNAELSLVMEDINELSGRVTEKQALLDEYIEKCNDYILLAAKSREEGDLRYQQAKSAFARKRYQEARSRITDAAGSYDKSLAKQEDPEVRRKRNEDLTGLSRRIDGEENRLVIIEVRELIDRGRSLYSKGTYKEAEATLIQARTRWSDTQTDTNEEIEYWLGLVRVAINFETEREVPDTDPLFSDISRLYNLAKDYYLQGKELMRKGEKTPALDFFSKAKNKIINIMMPFPYNNDARVLELLITKESDPSEFQKVIDSKFAEAEAFLLKKDKNEQLKGLSTLEDLLQFEPDSGKLKEAIRRAKIAVGILKEPPSRKDIAESNRLTRQAKPIVDSRNKDLYPVADEALKKAIKLNPDNKLAMSLKDDILRDSNERVASSVLDSYGQNLYNEALKLFLAGRTLEAKVKIDTLWKIVKYRKSPDVIDLREMVYAN